MIELSTYEFQLNTSLHSFAAIFLGLYVNNEPKFHAKPVKILAQKVKGLTLSVLCNTFLVAGSIKLYYLCNEGS